MCAMGKALFRGAGTDDGEARRGIILAMSLD
jgi:hypothetical protein